MTQHSMPVPVPNGWGILELNFFAQRSPEDQQNPCLDLDPSHLAGYQLSAAFSFVNGLYS
jgi:hypothetical protein